MSDRCKICGLGGMHAEGCHAEEMKAHAALVERANKLADWCEGAGQRDASEAASTIRELAEALSSCSTFTQLEQVGISVDAGDFIDFDMNNDLRWLAGEKLYRFRDGAA